MGRDAPHGPCLLLDPTLPLHPMHRSPMHCCTAALLRPRDAKLPPARPNVHPRGATGWGGTSDLPQAPRTCHTPPSSSGFWVKGGAQVDVT